MGLGNGEPDLGGLPGQRELRAAQVGRRTLQIGERRLRVSAEAAPQVDLPRQVERRAVVREDRAEDPPLGSRNREADEVLLPPQAVVGGLHRRPETGGGYARVGRRLLEPGRGRLQIEVALEGTGDRRGQARILERGPPVGGDLVGKGVGHRGPGVRNLGGETRRVDRRRGGAASGRDDESEE